MSRTRRRDHYRCPDARAIRDGASGIYASRPTAHDPLVYNIRPSRRAVARLLTDAIHDPEAELVWPVGNRKPNQLFRRW